MSISIIFYHKFLFIAYTDHFPRKAQNFTLLSFRGDSARFQYNILVRLAFPVDTRVNVYLG